MPAKSIRKKAKASPAKSRKKAKPLNKTRAHKSPPGKPGPVNKWMELRHSPIHGLGAFARRDIPKGTRIIEYKGQIVDNDEADRRYVDDKMNEHHTFLFILTSKLCVDAAFNGNEARFINHSCAANSEPIVGYRHIWIDAKKRIPAGTEITYDYAYEEEDDYTEADLRFYACHCGAPTCRHTIVDTKRKLTP